MLEKEGMLTGKEEPGANAEQIPVCRGARDEQGNLVMECKQPGSSDWVITPEDQLGIFAPQATF